VGLGLQGGPAPQPGAAQELTIVSRSSEVMRDVYAGELTIGKLVERRVDCLPWRWVLSLPTAPQAAPPMPV
jgi:hypothetical protein